MRKPKLTNRCTGHCCEDIGLAYSPEHLKKGYENFLASGTDRLYMGTDSITPRLYMDIHLIYPMLTFSHKDNRHPESPKPVKGKVFYHYTCKHFDKKTRNCTIYPIRPDMCSSYPNEKGYCGNPGCTDRKLVKAREKRLKDLASPLKRKKKHKKDP